MNELKEFLPKLSEKGSGDDVSVAAVLNMQGKSITENLFRSPQSTDQSAESDEIGTDYSNREQPEADEIECE